MREDKLQHVADLRSVAITRMTLFTKNTLAWTCALPLLC